MKRINLYFRTICILAGSMLITTEASSQFNIKVGYNGGYADLDKTDLIFDRFNEANPSATKELKDIRYLHGLELGARYKFFGNWALDAGISSISNDSKATGITNSSGSLISNEWKISLTNYYIGLETMYNHFGLGGNIGYQKLKYSADVTGSGSKSDIQSETALFSKLFLVLEMPSDNIAFSIRPYVSFNLDAYNIDQVDKAIFPSSGLPATDFNEDVMVFGVSFMFYNGPQE